jgi:SRSO17 transposase
MNAVGVPVTSRPPPFEVSQEQVRRLAKALRAYHARFAGLFYRREQRHWALKYLQGLLLPDANKSVEKLALRVQGGNVRNMQQFIGEGRWEDGLILRKRAELVTQSLGHPAGVLIVDGSEFPKKGEHSAGVARQYCGATGKIDNCQAAVFLAYASHRGHALLDARLYLPGEWFEAPSQQRWQRCGIPVGTPFRTKPELAWEMIQKVAAQGAVPFRGCCATRVLATIRSFCSTWRRPRSPIWRMWRSPPASG